MLTKQTIQPQLLSSREAARWLGVSERTLWSLTNDGEIPFLKIRRSKKYDVADLLEYVANQKQSGVSS